MPFKIPFLTPLTSYRPPKYKFMQFGPQSLSFVLLMVVCSLHLSHPIPPPASTTLKCSQICQKINAERKSDDNFVKFQKCWCFDKLYFFWWNETRGEREQISLNVCEIFFSSASLPCEGRFCCAAAFCGRQRMCISSSEVERAEEIEETRFECANK